MFVLAAQFLCLFKCIYADGLSIWCKDEAEDSGNISDCSACVWSFHLSVMCETFLYFVSKSLKLSLIEKGYFFIF